MINPATPLADTILYEHLSHQTLAPLIVVLAAAVTALIFLLVPLLWKDVR